MDSDERETDIMSELDDLEFDLEPTGTIAELGSELAQEEETSRYYLRARFIEHAISTLRRARYDQGMSQKEIAAALGTKQPAIARLEKARDISLGKIWDYLYACGRAPLPVQTVEYKSLKAFVSAYPDHPVTLNAVLGHQLISNWQQRLLNERAKIFPPVQHNDRFIVNSLVALSLNTLPDTMSRPAPDPMATPGNNLNRVPSRKSNYEFGMNMEYLVKDEAPRCTEGSPKAEQHRQEVVA